MFLDKDFEEDFIKIYNLVTKYATDFYEKEFSENPNFLEESRLEFTKKIHEWWWMAQDLALKLILEIEEKQRIIDSDTKNIRREDKKYRENPDYLNLLKEKKILRNRIIIINRLMDTIAWTMVGDSTYFKCSDTGTDHHGYLINKNIEATIKFCEIERKKWNFVLINDITACVWEWLWDITFIESVSQNVTFIELKEGKMNELVIEYISSFSEDLSDWERIEILKDLKGNSTKIDHFDKQLHRFIKQHKRSHDVNAYVKEWVWVGADWKKRMTIEEKEIPSRYHLEILLEAIEKTKKTKEPVIFTFWEFTYFGFTRWGYQSQSSRWNIGHLIYHYIHKDFHECCYVNEDISKFEKEIKEYHSYEFKDFVLWSMLDKYHDPIFLKPISLEDLLDLLYWKLSIYIYFDKSRFIDIMNWLWIKTIKDKRKEDGLIWISMDLFWDGEMYKIWEWRFFDLFINLLNPEDFINQFISIYNNGNQFWK
jgi:hypothetical protein